MPTPESRVKAKLNKALEDLGPGLYKFMPVPGYRGFGGVSLDYLICAHGHWVAIETKRDQKAQVTARQIVTMNQMLAAGATVFVVYDDKTMNEAVNKIKDLLAVPCEVQHLNLHRANPAWAVHMDLRTPEAA